MLVQLRSGSVQDCFKPFFYYEVAGKAYIALEDELDCLEAFCRQMLPTRVMTANLQLSV
jgi:hypothetical protein